MLLDHQNLLSTFGKDSQSSNRKSKYSENNLKVKRMTLNYDMQPKSRYQEILNRRKTLMMLEKSQKQSIKTKNVNKKLKTQSDIDYLNNCIRRSISGIAQTICKSKIKSTVQSKCSQLSLNHSSTTGKINKLSKDVIQSNKNLKTYTLNETLNKKNQFYQKENINNLNNFQQSNRNKQGKLNKNEYLKNSTKKKGKFFEYDKQQCRIKSSFSIDLNSQKSKESFLQSSRKWLNDKKSQNHPINSAFVLQSSLKQIQKKNLNFKKNYPQLKMNDQMQETLKKQLKQLTQSDLTQEPKFLQTKGAKDLNNLKQQFLFYEDQNAKKQIKKHVQKFSHLTNKNITEIGKNDLMKISQQNVQTVKNYHKLIETIIKQIELDFDLRHAKHMFSGIQQPFYAFTNDDCKSQCKWQKLNMELQMLGLHYSVETIKKIFLPSEQEIDPFLSVAKPHEQLIYSLIYAYQTAQIHWQQKIYQQWQHWDLRDIDLTIENIDRQRKGYITVQDVAAFISMQTGRQYKNRDVILIYKRLVNGFYSIRNVEIDGIYKDQHELKPKLKFRALIDCLIKPFSNKKLADAKK